MKNSPVCESPQCATGRTVLFSQIPRNKDFPTEEFGDALSAPIPQTGHTPQVNSPEDLLHTRSETAGWQNGHPTSALPAKEATYHL